MMYTIKFFVHDIVKPSWGCTHTLEFGDAYNIIPSICGKLLYYSPFLLII